MVDKTASSKKKTGWNKESYNKMGNCRNREFLNSWDEIKHSVISRNNSEMPPRVSGEVLENARFPIFKKRLLQAQAYNIKIKVNPNTTFYSYYFFPRAPRSDFEVLFLSFFWGGGSRTCQTGRTGRTCQTKGEWVWRKGWVIILLFRRGNFARWSHRR